MATRVNTRKRVPLDRDQIIEAAAAIADGDGLDALTLTRAAEELSVQQPALYRHVAGIDDLIRLLSLRGRQILSERLANAAIGLSRADALTAVGHEWRAVAKDHPGLYAATDRYPCSNDEELQMALDRVLHVVRQAIISYDLTDAERYRMACAIRAAFHGFAHLELGDGHPAPVHIDDSFNDLIHLLSSGLEDLEEASTAARDQESSEEIHLTQVE